MTTKFEKVFNCFYSKITDDMYMELDEIQTRQMSTELLLNALPWFEFPRVNIMDYDANTLLFNVNLTQEEINIIATYMMIGWFDQQLASIELVRMKYSGSDFKFTSQANHMAKLMALKKEYERIGFHLQRLYKRRKIDKNGQIKSTLSSIMSQSVRRGYSASSEINNSNSNCNCGEELGWNDFPINKNPSQTPDIELPPNNNNTSGDNSWEDMNDLDVSKPSIEDGFWEEM